MDDSLRRRIFAAIDREAEAIERISLEIHAHPELAFEETHAVKLQTEFLARSGFRVESGVAGMATAFKACAGSGRPAVAFMSEYDALPEIGHGCGHNLIAAAALAAGLGLRAALDSLPGRVCLLGTPAEEGGGGKIKMVEAGVFADFDFAMMVHPSCRTEDDGGANAILRVEFRFTGKSAHAAASPEKGVNALDAVMLTFAGINALRQHTREDARIHGIVTDGGVKPNIVPEHAAAVFYVRGADDEYVHELLGKVVKVAEGAALMTGAELGVITSQTSYTARIPSQVLTRIFHAEAEALGFEFEKKEHPGRGSSDSGNVSRVLPTIHPYFKVVPGDVSAHSSQFAECAGKAEAIREAVKAGKAMAAAAAAIFSDEQLREEMAQEFAARHTNAS